MVTQLSLLVLNKGTGEGSTKVKKTDSLYKRSSFRKGTRVKAERVVSMKTGEVKPTRKEVLDEYNARLRVQCHECNISHKFEGIEGTYKGEIKE